MQQVPFRAARDLEQAVKDRIKKIVTQDPARNPSQEFKIWTFNRFLARVYHLDRGAWILKGGTANLMRVAGARMTRDIDLQVVESNLDDAFDELASIVSLELGDHLKFAISEKRRILTDEAQANTRGYRVTISVTLGQKKLLPILVDLTVDTDPIIEALELQSATDIGLPGLVQPKFWVVTIESQLGEKSAALFQYFNGATSSRGKDLIDIVDAAHRFQLSRVKLLKAFEASSRKRGVAPANQLPVLETLRPTFDSIRSRTASLRWVPDLEQSTELFNLLLSNGTPIPETATWYPDTLGWRD